MKQPLVSIVVPVYNAERFIKDTIKSVQNQTYSNWELILVDDTSTDKSVEIIKKFQKVDSRIKVIARQKNRGVAEARNTGIEHSSGDYIAFLDADDTWASEKIEKQLNFMKAHTSVFSFTGYQFADEQGVPNGAIVSIPRHLTYKQALKNTTIWTSTVMFNLSLITKREIHMPNIPSEDMATWWRILGSGVKADGLQETLSFYRRSGQTLSSNKLTAVQRTWNLYRKHENLSLIPAVYNFCWYIFNATRRRV